MPAPQSDPNLEHVTFHLVPAEVWAMARDRDLYRPETFDAEGFVHCTDGLEALLVPANAYYRQDPRPYLALALDLSLVNAPVRYDDEARLYPHIYGPVDTAAAMETFHARRQADGTFEGFDPIPV